MAPNVRIFLMALTLLCASVGSAQTNSVPRNSSIELVGVVPESGFNGRIAVKKLLAAEANYKACVSTGIRSIGECIALLNDCKGLDEDKKPTGSTTSQASCTELEKLAEPAGAIAGGDAETGVAASDEATQ